MSTIGKTKINGSGYIKLDVAIEIKTNFGRRSDEEGEVFNDIDKLLKQRSKNPEIKLFLLYFVRWHTKKVQKKHWKSKIKQ